ncbi:hypothetical protein VPNG_05859 [Cytospora leucostoma]|uniref:Cobalamin-independent methionine synthase MetE C-terminal/archaeal domain-containing protein n=1 Tax=Cytospora leucostoma TaxID=1230097 RepID=A0A423X0G0_9PEZI|nr:hypothetical protein VPNG_05859 [Cytospora leucostoma]
MAPLFRADQVGSLLRPASLLEVRAKHNVTSSYDAITADQEVVKATHDAVATAVKLQLEKSVYPVTTGELERSIFYGGFFETLEGLTTVPDLPIPDAFRTNFCTTAALQRAGVTTRPGVVATGKIRWAGPAYGDSWALLRGLVPAGDLPRCKVTMPSPTYQHMQLRRGTAFTPGSGYASDGEYFADLAAAYRAELRSLYDAGCRNVQVDDPNMTFFVVDEFREGCRADGLEPEALVEEYVRVHNACIADLPGDLHVGIHLCRGNLWNEVAKRGVASGSYERIAERMFNGLNYNTFFLEYDDERSGDFEPLRFVPPGKTVVLGLVSTKRAEMESIDDLARRVSEAAAVIAKAQGRTADEVLQDQLAVSAQCGFASQSQGGGAGMTEERQWEKLVLVRDLARKLWKDAI